MHHVSIWCWHRTWKLPKYWYCWDRALRLSFHVVRYEKKNYQSYVINISRSLHGRIINNNFKWGSLFFSRNSYRGCLVYMFSLCFLGSTFLINLRWQFRVRKIFNTQVFAGFAVFILCLRLFRKCVNYLVLGCSLIETC